MDGAAMKLSVGGDGGERGGPHWSCAGLEERAAE